MQVAKRANTIGSTTNNLVELEALQEGLQICLNLGVSKLIIERDLQIILNVIRKRNKPNWVLNSKLEEVLNIMVCFKDIQILHIFWEGNKKPYQLANKDGNGENILIYKE